MRTTLRIDDDLLSRLKTRADAENLSLTRLVNRVLRTGLAAMDTVADEPPHREHTYSMGAPLIDLTRASGLAEALQDEETVRKLLLRK